MYYNAVKVFGGLSVPRSTIRYFEYRLQRQLDARG